MKICPARPYVGCLPIKEYAYWAHLFSQCEQHVRHMWDKFRDTELDYDCVSLRPFSDLPALEVNWGHTVHSPKKTMGQTVVLSMVAIIFFLAAQF